MAERHAYGPGENFEFLLWDDLMRAKPTLVSIDEKNELISLIVRCDAFVSFNVDTGMLQVIDIDDRSLLLEKRNH
jgi:hypothetical protein